VNALERRTTDDLRKEEIIHCLERYVARKVYAALRAHPKRS
jgi:hypothetical protein